MVSYWTEACWQNPDSTKGNLFSTSLNKISKYFELKNNIEIPNVRVSMKIKFPIVSVAVAKRGGGGREGKKRAPSIPFLPLPYPFRCPLRRISSLMFLIISFRNNLNSFDENSFSWSEARPVSSRRRGISIRSHSCENKILLAQSCFAGLFAVFFVRPCRR